MISTDKILSYLENEQSRFIYRKRVEYNETGDFNAIKAIVERYLPKLWDKTYYPGMGAELPKLLADKSNIVIFGSGMNGKSMLHVLKAHGIMPTCYADNAKDKWGTRMEGLEIKCPTEIDFRAVDAVVITPFKQEIVDAIRKQLIELGVKEETLLNYKIHAFEPDSVSYEKCMDMLKGMPDADIKLYNAGLWSEDTTLYFAEMGNAASRISKEETGTSIKTVALDNCISGPVSFIKMDIEGAELEALKGCREIIKQYRPRLAISAYHKKEDLVELPSYIKELLPEYKLYIRHYSNAAVETVLYAV